MSSFNGHSSGDTLVVETLIDSQPLRSTLSLGHTIPRDMSECGANGQEAAQKAHILSSTRTSEDTLLNDTRPKKAKKEKKAPRSVPQQSGQSRDKLCERISHIFADQLSGGAKYVNSSDVIRNFVNPPIELTYLGISKTTNSESTLISTTQTDQGSQLTQIPSTNKKMSAKYRIPGKIFCLDELSAKIQVEKLIETYGKVSHMGVLDSSYSLFLSNSRNEGLLFKVYDSVAVVSGDPLCEWHRTEHVMAEFAAYRKKLSLDIVFLGATSEFVQLAKSRNWIIMQFGSEAVLNPMSNPVLLETAGVAKRTISNSKQLLNKNVSLGIYLPKFGTDQILQTEIMQVYNEWCSEKNDKPIVQAYVSVLDPLAMPNLMIYIFARDASGKLCGFAALRKIVNGYHIDPCVAKPGAPRGITELLIIAAMSLLRQAGISYLSLGFSPTPELGDVSGIPKFALGITRSIHKRSVAGLPIGGKQAFYDKFRPDESQQNDMFVVIPTRGLPKVKHIKAMLHIVNIDISKLLRENIKKSLGSKSDSGESEQKIEEPLDQAAG